MYVVMGATGNTGNVVANSLLGRGQKVRAIGRSAERLKTLAAKGAEAFVGDIADAQTLSDAFTGAEAAYVMIPPNMGVHDFRAYQDRVSEAIGAAIEKARIEYVVSLSSIGADKAEHTGPVVGLHLLERRLNRIAGLNVCHLRAGYFMENTLAQIGIIKAHGIASGPLRPDLKLPMIATRDVGAFAAEALWGLDFRKQETCELLGQRDIGMSEAAAIIGGAIGKPGLAYSHAPDEQVRMALTQLGLSMNLANLILEMSAALNSGYMRALEQRSARNTTPTSYEAFVAEEFAPLYERQSAAA
ncbi:MAG: NAD(P)H-binding protein [Acidobacteriia bacterium]|nr:NAD(P)H-binding protein [Terriglobia bacterium]